MAVTTAPRTLGQPVIEDGIRWLNFFNGRVLSAEDLRVDHAAIAESRRQLGRAVGAGVVTGFGVAEAVLTSTNGQPILAVEPGLAFNEAGEALELHRAITIGLVRPDAPTGGDGGPFARCDVVLPGTTGLGAYVLVVGPASADLGKAAVAGFGNQPAACNTAYSVEGVDFELVPLPLEEDDRLPIGTLRNRIAYRLFGVGASGSEGLVTDPFRATEPPPTLLDELRADCFGATQVPLAVLYWEPAEGLGFVDQWAIRRRPTMPPPADRFGVFVAERTLADGEARFLQFQQHLRDVVNAATPVPPLKVAEHFRYLPPAGLLPLTAGGSRGLELSAFFAEETVTRHVHIEGATVPPLIRESLAYPPIDLRSDEAIRIYAVRENVRAAQRGYAVFASGHLPYRGDAKYDLAYWNVANYAQRY
jgi:hypothetical protein